MLLHNAQLVEGAGHFLLFIFGSASIAETEFAWRALAIALQIAWIIETCQSTP